MAINLVMSVCLFTWHKSFPTGRIFMKFDMRIFGKYIEKTEG
jgi:hypothetical protein